MNFSETVVLPWCQSVLPAKAYPAAFAKFVYVFIISGSGKYLDTNRQTNTRPSNLRFANF